MGRDRIGQTARILNSAEGGQHLRGNFGIEFHVLLELRRHRAHQDFSLALVELTLGYRCRINNKTVFCLNVIDNPGSTDPFDQHFDRPIRQLQQLQDIGNGSDAENVLRRRIVVGCVMLGCEENLLTRLDSFFQRIDGFLPPDKKRQHHMREHHYVPKRQHLVAGTGRNVFSGRIVAHSFVRRFNLQRSQFMT